MAAVRRVANAQVTGCQQCTLPARRFRSRAASNACAAVATSGRYGQPPAPAHPGHAPVHPGHALTNKRRIVAPRDLHCLPATSGASRSPSQRQHAWGREGSIHRDMSCSLHTCMTLALHF
jgi:hypothetical protein